MSRPGLVPRSHARGDHCSPSSSCSVAASASSITVQPCAHATPTPRLAVRVLIITLLFRRFRIDSHFIRIAIVQNLSSSSVDRAPQASSCARAQADNQRASQDNREEKSNNIASFFTFLNQTWNDNVQSILSQIVRRWHFWDEANFKGRRAPYLIQLRRGQQRRGGGANSSSGGCRSSGSRSARSSG